MFSYSVIQFSGPGFVSMSMQMSGYIATKYFEVAATTRDLEGVGVPHIKDVPRFQGLRFQVLRFGGFTFLDFCSGET